MQRTAGLAALAFVVVAAVVTACSCGAALSPKRGGDIPPGTGGNGGFGGSGGGSGGGAGAVCTTAADCPTSFTCEAGVCVPPEQQTNLSTNNSPPVATPHYVYALNPTAASVARIDPVSLAIEAVPVGPAPVGLAALPGEDAAVVLSYNDGSLSVVDSAALPSKVTRVSLERQYARLTVSQDGAWAVAWPDPLVAPASGAEGVFALIDLHGVRAGKPAAQTVLELGGGFRITDVIFRVDNAVATQLYVFAKSSVSVFDLASPSGAPLRLALPASMSADVTSRSLVANDDGHLVVLRSMTDPELASFDGATLTTVPLPEVATDLQLVPDGSAAVVALRTSSTLAYLRIPEDFQDPAGMLLLPVPGGAVGRVALPPTVPASGLFAFVYSNVSGDKSFARVDLPGGAVTRYQLEKLVEEISLSPDSASAVIIHRSDPNTTATDPYQAQVDKDEGFSVFDVASGFWELQRTSTIRPTRYAYSPAGGYVGVALRDDIGKRYQLQAVNLTTLVSTTLSLASAPLFMGTVPQAPGITPHRVFVSQDHPAGRISIIQLDTNQVRTVTGFTLNAEIQ